MPTVPVYDPDRYYPAIDDDWEAVPGQLSSGDVKDITPDENIFEEHEPIKYLHPGPLGFVDVTHRATKKKSRKKFKTP